MRKLAVTFIIVIIIVTILLGGCTSSQAGSGNTLGKMAVDFQLFDIYGNQVALSDFRGKPVLLNFWTTWCDPCKIEMPFFQGIHEDEEWLQKGLVILAVNLQENVNNVQQYMTNNGFSFTVLLDMSGAVGNKYNIRGIPTTFFIDKDGIIKDVAIGAFQNKTLIELKLSLITD